MFGGLINNNSYFVVQPNHKQLHQQQRHRKYVLIAMANSLAVFDQQTSILINTFSFHTFKILHFAAKTQQQFTKIVSVDASGQILFIKLSISFEQPISMIVENRFNVLISSKTKSKQDILTDARIDINNDILFFITPQKVLHQYNLVTRKSKKIGGFAAISGIFSNKVFLFPEEDQRQIVVLNIQNSQIIFKYSHTSKIVSCCIIKQLSIALGDQKGKIFIHENALSLKESKKNEGNESYKKKILKLQWHLHSVLTLASNGNYLYSGGQQGTVVIWQIRDGTKDFLPRVGATITNIFVQNTSQNSFVTCFLQQNVVKTIDMNQDKKVTQYKILVNPDSYKTVKSQNRNQERKRFNQLHFNRIQQTVCMNSLPGKLQFLNLRSGQNSEVQIVQRNYISRLDNDYPNPHQIVSFAFNKNWNSMVVSVEGQNHSSLSFYSYQAISEKKSDWKLITKVKNPHQGPIYKCLFIQSPSENKDMFLTFGKNDPNIKIWKMKTQKKKSILEIDQQFWACDLQINYRNICPHSISSVNGRAEHISIVYPEQVIFIDCSKGKLLKSYDIKNVTKFYSKGSKDSSSLEYIYQIGSKVYFETQQLQKKSTPKKSTQKSANAKKQRNVKFIEFETDQIQIYENLSESKIAIHAYNQKKDRIVIYNFSANKIESEFQLQRKFENRSQIQSLFWLKDRLIIITQQLLLCDITHNLPIFDNVSNGNKKNESVSLLGISMEVQSAETRDIVIDLQIAEQRWVDKETRKRKNLIDDISNSITASPSFITGFRMLSENLLL